MRPHSIVRTLAAVALLLVPTVALAAPDPNTNQNNYPNNGCPNGQWRDNNGQCVGNGNWNNGNNGQWNNNGRHRHHDRDDNQNNNGRNRDDQRGNGNWNNNNGHDRDDHRGNGNWNNGRNGNWNNGGYNNGGYNNGRYGNRGNQLSGVVSQFSPYNLYLSNGTHVQLHNGTVINPTGANLTQGERVRVIGNWNSDGTFNANEIDVVSNGRYRY